MYTVCMCVECMMRVCRACMHACIYIYAYARVSMYACNFISYVFIPLCMHLSNYLSMMYVSFT